MALDDAQKVTILIAALQERYQALRTIRERVQSIGLWTLGILLAASGWLIQNDKPIPLNERIVGIIGVIAAICVLRFIYIRDLQKGFSSQQRVAARLEGALSLYETGAFDDDFASILPKSWADAGTADGHGQFFSSTYRLLYVGVAFLVVALAAT